MRRVRTAILAVAAVFLATACSPSTAVTQPPSASPGASSTASPAGSPARSASSPPQSATGAPSAFDPAGLSVTVAVAVDGLEAPLDVTHAGDGTGRIFAAEQAGRIRIVKEGALVERPFLDIRERIRSGGERGLLGLAFHPDYPADPRVFVDYTDLDGHTVIASFRVSATDPDVADPASETILLHIEQPFANHNGGAVEFGPDGMLYIGMGDGGAGGDPRGNGQRMDTLLGKILRIDVDGGGSDTPYAVPPDNPFVAVAGARPEIWLTGLRNPWRMNFDGATGDLWIGDVGQNRWEEIDVARAGEKGLNYGWNVMEGFHCFDPSEGCDQTGLTLPVTEYSLEGDRCAVIGGVVVRDPRQGRLDGGYLFGDACADTLWAIDPAGDGRREPVAVAQMGRSLSSIGTAEDGSVYATSLGGELLRITGGS